MKPPTKIRATKPTRNSIMPRLVVRVCSREWASPIDQHSSHIAHGSFSRAAVASYDSLPVIQREVSSMKPRIELAQDTCKLSSCCCRHAEHYADRVSFATRPDYPPFIKVDTLLMPALPRTYSEWRGKLGCRREKAATAALHFRKQCSEQLRLSAFAGGKLNSSGMVA